MKTSLFFLGVLLLIASEFFRYFFITPFPGSQYGSALDWSYFLHSWNWGFRILSISLMLPFIILLFPKKKWWAKTLFILPLGLCGFVLYVCNYIFPAETMFFQMEKTRFASAAQNKIDPRKLVIGIEYKGEARAYPIEIIGYHHQVIDSINNEPIIATYCTVCRTGRIYKSSIDKKKETFRLVGMDQFNAMFEDESTGSWWQQATGECVAGSQKGKKMDELFSQQMTLEEWMELHPNTKILQEDLGFKKDYDYLAEYDEGTIQSDLEGRDPGSWKMKSWVVGVLINGKAYAIDWNDLQKKKVINTENFVLVMLKDNINFFAFSNVVDNVPLDFTWDAEKEILTDKKTSSPFNLIGLCTEGPLKDKIIKPIPAYQEFWHSWQTFHAGTIQVKN